ncbi:hypothetical protein BVRB_9g214460 [Beta vulgaris subsp. vulgaris]|nr:hypothetical protein BVRB_9g214460 [Beta vulgaris subsp. vulgaris]
MSKSLFAFLKFVIFTIYVVELTFIWAERPETPSWATTEPYGHEQKTVLQFYFHEIALGENSTIALIAEAQPVQPNRSFASFGNLFMADELLTVGPDINSKLIGRAQGFSGSVSQTEEVHFILGLVYSFTDGIYNGSSFTVLGQNSLVNTVRELPIVSGTGRFRMARGYALAQTYLFNPTSGIVIVGYNVTLIHP